MFVKICGLTNLDDSLAAIDGGAGALGFNFYAGSPRYVAPASLEAWIGRIPSEVWKVGVFVNESPAQIAAIAERLALDVVQLHGAESPGDVPATPRAWKAARVTNGFRLSDLYAYPVEALLLDGPASGIQFDWSLASALNRKLILAGGLDASNVRAAIDQVNPWGVDVCSRIESAPGKKDHVLMQQFLKTVMP